MGGADLNDIHLLWTAWSSTHQHLKHLLPFLFLVTVKGYIYMNWSNFSGMTMTVFLQEKAELDLFCLDLDSWTWTQL